MMYTQGEALTTDDCILRAALRWTILMMSWEVARVQEPNEFLGETKQEHIDHFERLAIGEYELVAVA